VLRQMRPGGNGGNIGSYTRLGMNQAIPRKPSELPHATARHSFAKWRVGARHAERSNSCYVAFRKMHAGACFRAFGAFLFSAAAFFISSARSNIS
jgi:hypothetical protein